MSERPPISPRSPRAALEPEQVPPPPKRSERARNPFAKAVKNGLPDQIGRGTHVVAFGHFDQQAGCGSAYDTHGLAMWTVEWLNC